MLLQQRWSVLCMWDLCLAPCPHKVLKKQIYKCLVPSHACVVQVHSRSMGALQQGVWCWYTETDGEMPNVPAFLQDSGWSSRWWVWRAEARRDPALLPYALPWSEDWAGGRKSSKPSFRERGVAWLGVWGLHWVFWNVWWRWEEKSHY